MIASMSVHDEPVTNRICSPRKHTSSATLGLWQPNGCESSGGATNGSTAAQIASDTFRSIARVMTPTASTGRWRVNALAIKREPPTTGGCRLPVRLRSLWSRNARVSSGGVGSSAVGHGTVGGAGAYHR